MNRGPGGNSLCWTLVDATEYRTCVGDPQSGSIPTAAELSAMDIGVSGSSQSRSRSAVPTRRTPIRAPVRPRGVQ
jgi:hypothetical protein